MKILYLHQYYNTPKMNGSTRSYEFARHFASLGHDVRLITLDRDGKYSKKCFTNRNGVEVLWIPAPYQNSFSFYRRVTVFLKYAYHTFIYTQRFEYDLIYASSTPLTVAIPAILAKKMRNKPFVFEVRDLWPEIPINLGIIRSKLLIWASKYLAAMAYKNAFKIIALSPGFKKGILSYGVKENKISVIPNGCDVEKFTFIDENYHRQLRNTIPSLESASVLTYAGTLGEVNNVGYLIRLVETLKKSIQVKLLIVGEGKEKPQLLELAKRLGVLDNEVSFLAAVPKNVIPTIFHLSDIICSTVIDNRAMWDNSANKFFDGLAAGRPVLINHGGWQRVLLEEHAAGLVLDPNDIGKASKKLFTFLSEPDVVLQTGKNAKKLAQLKFDRERLFLKLDNAIFSGDD